MEPKAKDKLAAARAALPLARDVQAIHTNGSASLSELREFLAGLKGKNPQEVIGIVSTSLLIQSLTIAVLATLAIMVVFTVGPYLIHGPEPLKAAKKPPAAASATATPETAADPQQPTVGEPGQPDAQRAAAAMGLDETKTSDPKQNPLDKPDLDKLLDGVE